jgi:hypothetical protein
LLPLRRRYYCRHDIAMRPRRAAFDRAHAAARCRRFMPPPPLRATRAMPRRCRATLRHFRPLIVTIYADSPFSPPRPLLPPMRTCRQLFRH